MTLKEELQKTTQESKQKQKEHHLGVVTDYLSEQCRLEAGSGNSEAKIIDINMRFLSDGQILTENDVKEFAKRENITYSRLGGRVVDDFVVVDAILSWEE